MARTRRRRLRPSRSIEPAAAVDGNVERVIARLFSLEEPLPAGKARVRALAQTLVPQMRPGDYAQAMMDLGATVCTPRSPSCGGCPVRGFCSAAAAGVPERYPIKAPKPARPVRRGDAFVIVKGAGKDARILLRRRPEKGLLGGMMEVPCTEWVAAAAQWSQARLFPPIGSRRSWCATPSRIFIWRCAYSPRATRSRPGSPNLRRRMGAHRRSARHRTSNRDEKGSRRRLRGTGDRRRRALSAGMDAEAKPRSHIRRACANSLSGGMTTMIP